MSLSPRLTLVHDTAENHSLAARTRQLNAWYGEAQILRNVEVDFKENQINCLIGPSGSGKSTLIRSINRINDDIADYRIEGEILFGNANILSAKTDVVKLRTEIGMVFQKPCVFPKSIAENVLFGIEHLQKLSPQQKMEIVEENIKAVALWKEVAHRLQDRASQLSLGQQQRLCIARSLAVKPRILLLDEPTSALDPQATRAIEDLLVTLKEHYTIIFVTHNIQQAQRIADRLIFMCQGEIIEQGEKDKLFSNPAHELTQKYLNEEFCDC